LTPSEQAAAKAAHICLYAATVAVPLAGWAVVSTSPLHIPSYVFNLFVVPNLPLTVSNASEALWSSIHAFLAYAAGFIAAVHILAALRHHFHFKDDVLARMLRPGRGRDGVV
jgi:cytochrome b561